MHYVNKESMALGTSSPSQQMLTKFSEATHGTVNQEPSARQMYEMVRSLGLNHESDVANSLVFQKNDHSQQDQQQQQENLKSVLMKLAQGEGQETNPKVAQQAEQALTNLTGQQLLSKSDGSGTLQSMFFNLPLMLGGKPENLQVFINSKNEGQQVEWENCNIYFLLETKKLGDVGILLNSTDRNLSITIKNDLPGFKEKIEPLASFTKEKLKEVGYNVSSINFARMSPVVANPSTTGIKKRSKSGKINQTSLHREGNGLHDMKVSSFYNQKKRKEINGPQAAVIKYDEETGKVPAVVAQGKGHVAQQIIELAKKNNIHMQEDSTLVANLLDMDLGDNIPPQLYSVMAEILLLIEEIEKNY